MTRSLFAAALLAAGAFFMSIPTAEAVVCARGVVRAGCAGPNGAVVVRKPVARAATTCRWINGVRVCRRVW